jgi:hypothetical protein
MNAAAIVLEARRQGVELRAGENDKIRWRSEGFLPQKLRQQIQENKGEILALLKAELPEPSVALQEQTKQTNRTTD